MFDEYKDKFDEVVLRRIRCEHQQQEDFGLLSDHVDNLQILIKAGGPPNEGFANLAMLAVSWVFGEIGLRYVNEAEELLKNEDFEGLAKFLKEHSFSLDDDNE